jgi:hypothetical protein
LRNRLLSNANAPGDLMQALEICSAEHKQQEISDPEEPYA